MFLPSYYHEKDRSRLLSFIRKHNFGMLVSVSNGEPFITHLPFLVEETDGAVVLTGHIARASDQVPSLQRGTKVTAVFREPHAYITPFLYEEYETAPTWNYVAVHAHGILSPVEDPEQVAGLMKKIVAEFDPEYYQRYKTLRTSYLEALYKILFMFQIRVDELEGNFKLSQEKSETNQQNIIEAFQDDPDPHQREIARMMIENLERRKGK